MIKKTSTLALLTTIIGAGSSYVAAAASSTLDYDNTKGLSNDQVKLAGEVKGGYIKTRSSNGEFEYKLDGRIMLDFGSVSNSKNDNKLYTNTEFRRLRLALKTRMYEHWKGEFDLDFAEAEIDLKDMWVAYDGFDIDNLEIKIGHHKPNFSMNEVTTSRWATFLETPMATDVFAPGRRIGASVTHFSNQHFIGATFFGDEANVNNADQEDDDGEDISGSERYGYSMRGVYRPFADMDNHKVFHLGINHMKTVPQANEENEVKFSNRPEAHFIDYKYLYTKIGNVDNVVTNGIEVAGLWDKFSMQGEILQTDVTKLSGEEAPNSSFDGAYLMFAYFLTSDYRTYNAYDGEFGPVKPSGKSGALELALRYSTLDLNDVDADIEGGKASNITLALNWYINNNFVTKINYIRVNNDETATGKKNSLVGNDDLNILGVRLQYLF